MRLKYSVSFLVRKFQSKVNALQAKLQEQLSPADPEVILRCFPERIQAASIARAAEIEDPIAISIASFLDT
jgi:hypothetical protein